MKQIYVVDYIVKNTGKREVGFITSNLNEVVKKKQELLEILGAKESYEINERLTIVETVSLIYLFRSIDLTPQLLEELGI